MPYVGNYFVPGKEYHQIMQRRREKNQRRREERKRQEELYEEKHRGDSDRQLLAYLRGESKRFQGMPDPQRVKGSTYLTKRFGSWENALRLAGVTPKNKEQRTGPSPCDP